MEYELTEPGGNLMVPRRSLYEWAVKHRPAGHAGGAQAIAEKERSAAGQRRFTTQT